MKETQEQLAKQKTDFVEAMEGNNSHAEALFDALQDIRSTGEELVDFLLRSIISKKLFIILGGDEGAKLVSELNDFDDYDGGDLHARCAKSSGSVLYSDGIGGSPLKRTIHLAVFPSEKGGIEFSTIAKRLLSDFSRSIGQRPTHNALLIGIQPI